MIDTLTGNPGPHPPPVVVGIDGSQAAIRAATWAVDEAIGRDVPLRLLFVISEQSEPAPFAAVGNEHMEREFGETALRIAAAAIQATGKNVKVETAMVHGDPATALADASRDAAMICVGSAGIGRIAKAFFGSTATELADAAHCSVAIIRSEFSQHKVGNTVVAVAIENSPDNDDVIEQALQEAQLRHTPVLALGAWRDDIDEMPPDELDRRMQGWADRYPSVEIHSVSTHMDVADFLAVIDRPVQLAVLGQGDTDQITRLVGSHRYRLFGNAECSVLIVRPRLS